MNTLIREYFEQLIDELASIYILFACKTCGLPWEEHEDCCSEHKNKDKYLNYRLFASKNPKYASVFRLAKSAGWIEPQLEEIYIDTYETKMRHVKITEIHANTGFIAQFGETVS